MAPRRKLMWMRRAVSGFVQNSTVLVDLETALVSALGRNLRDYTIRRTIGSLRFSSTDFTASFGHLSLGITVAGRDAITVGVTVLPDPGNDTDMHADWMYFHRIGFQGLAREISAGVFAAQGWNHVWDIRSGRKVDERRAPCLVITEGNNMRLDFYGVVSCLIALA